MFAFLETYIIQVITAQRKGGFPSFIKGVLWILSRIYQAIIFVRNWAYDQGLFRQYNPPVPVVMSIGNLVAGGTGKTPLTLILAQEFCAAYHTVILSRGYRSQAERLSSPVILSHGDGHGPILPVSFCGDEPYMLAKNLPEVVVVVGKDRRKGAILAAKTGGQLLLLDDGMQHRRLARDFEVVVMDGSNLFGEGYYLPRGFLRESLKSLARADIIILNNLHSDEAYEELKTQLAVYTPAPVVATRANVCGVWSLVDNSPVSLKGVKIGVFCAIAHPDYFLQTVKELGAEVVASHFERDHLDFKAQELNNFAKLCNNCGADFLVCTEKDQVKLVEPQKLCLPVVWVQIQLQIVQGIYEWNTFIAEVKSDLQNRI
ncbi:tetraacyldisaccharide 4'-kinase [Parachlamydia sp. AcF125]|uniref:tetraacyldisaccharide 4'-kinase n=1 Tax=Parachlamydia sp. AcF125 TaxID=2795736 RepID=UPI001BC8F71F|nr:tetraacyldisaccharide 4'-kinase [Parachlamydia sp. AcF125]MBS4167702.1 Tetraacyldisaccharide 4'-kinase [Parachlamydia sp. AcF125]